MLERPKVHMTRLHQRARETVTARQAVEKSIAALASLYAAQLDARRQEIERRNMLSSPLDINGT